MSYLGYVIEQLINEDEKTRIAREHHRKRRLAGMSGRSQAPADPSRAQSGTKHRLRWSLLSLRH